MLKAISLWQPWASLWLSPRKIHETRDWSTRFRGVLLVHAAKRLERDVDVDLDDILNLQFGPDWRKELPTGAIIGRVELVDCWRTEDIRPQVTAEDLACGDFSPGRFAWERLGADRFVTPIPYRGKQGLFDVPAEVVAEARTA
jgi:hypothetical protein